MSEAKITKNGIDFDEGSLDTMMQYFADPVLEKEFFFLAQSDMFYPERDEDFGKFEFVKDNDVYIITTNTCLNCDDLTLNRYCSISCEDLDR